jgi:hypothetical protein
MQHNKTTTKKQHENDDALRDFRVRFFKDGKQQHSYVIKQDTLAFVSSISAAGTLQGERRTVEDMQGNILHEWTNNR